MLALRLLAIIGLLALSTLPFAVAGDSNEDDTSHQISEDHDGEHAEEEGSD